MLHPIALLDEISSCTISLQFCVFYLPRTFLRTVSEGSQAILSVKFEFVLKFWSSNSGVISGPTKIPSFFLASLILVHFCLKLTNPSLSLFVHHFHRYVKPSFICTGAKYIFYLSTKEGRATFC